MLINIDFPYLELLASSIEPNNCSRGGEVFTQLDSYRVMLSQLFVTCTAEITLSAQVYVCMYAYSHVS